ncbi:D-alanyl-D-alanine carboxypeptidase/D-alanyl-D-alanine-endopeptidase [Curtobacterium sp. SORGH_AS_0776]|uniref:D-alanyl-D-alanine carboxypeptidase/D-alanyl-D-alanine endopeptidase n=1 Tax=Curtobacterium sp. SORGH_AS_0776 TaxID=3041798 RepID=UPI00285A08B0|nr:D-alanyl-D-alanine carboxypeptidase/D-alanyl-D-alanine-endopeptidase [Curtobacterium sp. SORGH_AS_0776]MDR6172231.1 D-alanyl-D-alanine carboxypeptidase/D-alanyl-D-alanine-endopeptidase (penicillin-binding protein 4) [Curtobacterium sp. SORGH_AS_0776]
MSDQQPSPRGVADRLRDARTAVRASFARRPVPWVAGGLATVLVLGSGGAVAVAAATMPTPTTTAAATPSATASSSPAPTTAAPTPTPTPSGRTVPDDAAGPSALRTCTITNAASASGLGAFEGYVMNAKTGEVLFSRNGDEAAQTGSVMKTLTTATALAVLGGDHRIPTTVTKESGGAIALVGHGDATLSAGGATVYPGAPTLAQLAQQVKAKLGNTPVTTIVTDDTYWNDADAWDPTWPVSERTIGYQPNVTALMVDGDRANPGAQTSPRSTDPVGRAGDLFRTALANAGVAGAGNAQIVKRATTSTDTIATVSSQPVSTLIGQMIPNSDNTLAEMLARISSKESGSDGSAASLTAVYQAALKSYGVDPAGIVIKDGSGESAANAVSPNFVAHLMVQVAAGAKGLGTLANALPVSGQSGTLASRFTGANAVARGKVHAKTGWIDSANTLGGYIDAADGTRLTFAFYAIGSSRAAALPALDAVTAATYSCGSRLTGS